MNISAIFEEILDERVRQEHLKIERDWKWSMATPYVESYKKLMPLMEEVGEVAHAVRVTEGFAVAGNTHENHGLRVELIQVAACAVAWIQALDAEAEFPIESLYPDPNDRPGG